MKQPHVLVRFAALTSSVLLVSGLIAYRVGAFDSMLTKAEPLPENIEAVADTPTEVLLSGSKYATVIQPSTVQNTTIDTPNPALMLGSKSAPTFLPGSKSAGLVTPPSPPKQAPAQPATPAANAPKQQGP